MAVAHTLGSPRIGRDRELKRAQEAFRQGRLDEAGLRAVGRALRAAHWRAQSEAGIDLLPVGDFAWHDQVLTHSLTFDVIPEHIRPQGDAAPTLHTLFAMANGESVDPVGDNGTPVGETAPWFDTDHVYQVPVFSADQAFQLSWTQLFEEVDEAQALGYRVKPVILGPLTYLWLGKAQDEAFDRLDLVERLLPLYDQIFHRLADQGVEWVQIDEPILALDLPQAWKNAYERVYNLLQRAPLKKLITTYFGGLQDNLGLAANLPVDGLHIDLVCAPEQYPTLLDRLPTYKTLSLGLVDGRNLEGCDVDKAVGVLRHAAERLGDRLWVAPSCSLLQGSDDEPKRWLAFAVQKCQEVALLAKAINDPESAAMAEGVAYGLAKAS